MTLSHFSPFDVVAPAPTWQLSSSGWISSATRYLRVDLHSAVRGLGSTGQSTQARLQLRVMSNVGRQDSVATAFHWKPACRA